MLHISLILATENNKAKVGLHSGGSGIIIITAALFKVEQENLNKKLDLKQD